MAKFPIYLQHEEVDCGPACLRMIAKYYGRHFKQSTLRNLTEIDREGVTLLALSKAAESIGLRSLGVKVSYETLVSDEIPMPCIIHWKKMHYVVVIRATNKYVDVVDPLEGKIRVSKPDFINGWIEENDTGIALLLETTESFFKTEEEEEFKTVNFLKLLKRHLLGHGKIFRQIILGLILLGVIQLIQPFLSQFIVDIGIRNNDVQFIYLILIGQLFLYVGQYSIEFIRRWLLLFIGIKINLSLISDFLIKLLNLPMGFFDSKLYGDIIQRIEDHDRIGNFLTTSLLDIIYSVLTVTTFSIVLFIYNKLIFFIFVCGTIIYILYVLSFQKKRKKLDYSRFSKLSQKQSNIFQIITGIQDIKISNTQIQKRWEWEKIQTNLFNVQIKSTKLEQLQQVGGSIITNFKDILITVVAAQSVINGEITLGAMLAIQFIIGQLNAPIFNSLTFFKSYQDARLSAERINEVHDDDDEYDPQNVVSTFPRNSDILLENISFRYSINTDYVLKGITIKIPTGKVCAIVGSSGSGKTTLLKLLLKFYKPTSGAFKVGMYDIESIDNHQWRSQIGAVLQDGFVFTDTIARNITMVDENVDTQKLIQACTVANLTEVIENLPLGINTKIGKEGIKLSTGQEQRVLIARAIYKDPEFLFFDEATSALDTKNEAQIIRNLKNVLKGRTSIVIAHRLSTVKSADVIIVLDKGVVVESGTHKDLISKRGYYFELVESQMDLSEESDES